jgi:hypothetical protein
MNIIIRPIFRYPEYAGQFKTSPLSGHEPEFPFIFKPILEDLKEYYWLVNHDTFFFPVEWYDQSTYDKKTDTYIAGPIKEVYSKFEIIGSHGEALLGIPQIMPLYAQYIKDDWNRLIAFSEKPKDIKAWLKMYRGQKRTKERADFISKTVDIGFANVDGAYWEIFTKKTELIDKLKKYLDGIEGIKIEENKLEQSYGI